MQVSKRITRILLNLFWIFGATVYYVGIVCLAVYTYASPLLMLIGKVVFGVDIFAPSSIDYMFIITPGWGMIIVGFVYCMAWLPVSYGSLERFNGFKKYTDPSSWRFWEGGFRPKSIDLDNILTVDVVHGGSSPLSSHFVIQNAATRFIIWETDCILTADEQILDYRVVQRHVVHRVPAACVYTWRTYHAAAFDGEEALFPMSPWRTAYLSQLYVRFTCIQLIWLVIYLINPMKVIIYAILTGFILGLICTMTVASTVMRNKTTGSSNYDSFRYALVLNSLLRSQYRLSPWLLWYSNRLILSCLRETILTPREHRVMIRSQYWQQVVSTIVNRCSDRERTLADALTNFSKNPQ